MGSAARREADKQNGPGRPLGEEEAPGLGEVWVWPGEPGDTHIRGHGGTRLAAPSRSVQLGKGFTECGVQSSVVRPTAETNQSEAQNQRGRLQCYRPAVPGFSAHARLKVFWKL